MINAYVDIKHRNKEGGYFSKTPRENCLVNQPINRLKRNMLAIYSKLSMMLNKPSSLPTIWRVPDALWQKIAPALEVNKPRQKSGRPRANDRPIFDALIYLARTGMQWSVLPKDFPPKSTVHDRFQEWIEYGCLEAAWALLLESYDQTGSVVNLWNNSK